MATFFKFDQFVEDLAVKVHDLNADTLKVYLTNAAPDAALDAVKADLAEITNQNGYTAPIDIVNTASQTGGVLALATGLASRTTTVTATGTVGPFRYVALYNDTPTSPADPLIGAWDYGSAVTLADTETFAIVLGDPVLDIE